MTVKQNINQNLEIMEITNEIKVGQKITFNYYGRIYTKKVKEVVIKGHGLKNGYNVNPIGSGTQYVGVDHEDVISVK